ncbi:hypothetical protein [Streptomyces scopuliridis]|uniref:hypothetical protein n=1 Tax=Streptomyces scopuliridis TaxID=452529 RepID=UPI003448E58F
MAEPVSQVSTLAIRQFAQLAQMASNPLTVVKHGRREDRAAAYDRFIQACSRAVRDRSEHDGIGEVWAAWQAVNLRASAQVRASAAELAQRVMATADSRAVGERERLVYDEEAAKKAAAYDRADLAYHPSDDDDEVSFVSQLTHFVTLARHDLLYRWWHGLMPGPLRRWYQKRL